MVSLVANQWLTYGAVPLLVHLTLPDPAAGENAAKLHIGWERTSQEENAFQKDQSQMGKPTSRALLLPRRHATRVNMMFF